MQYTLTKDERLKKGEFRVIRWTRYGETAHFLLLGSKNTRCMKRLAVAIRKKTGGAVDRNRMKRLIKEFFRLRKHIFVDYHDNLIRVKKLPPKLTWRETQEELERLLLDVNNR
jgi:ribonuclease P protein component